MTLATAQAQNPLAIPPRVSGTNFTLTLRNDTTRFFPGPVTNTMGANGNILGPTLVFQKGDSVTISVVNQLGEPTTMHWHGLHVPAEHDGGPHTVINANTTWTPSFMVKNNAGTYWYHPHLHQNTDKHVSKGIAGLIIVKDSHEASLNLPRTYGVDDFPLVIQTKDFDANNQIVYHTNSDDVLMVNATINPELTVPAQVVRFRVLNGSSQRVFNLGLTNNKPFHMIASDGGLLTAPLQLTRLRLAPGERAELLIDFGGMDSQSVYLKSYASELPNGIYGAANPGRMPMMTLNGYSPNPLNGNDFNILKFNVTAPTANAVTTIPTTLTTITPLSASSANITRTLSFTPATMGPNQLNGNFLINGATFDMNVINYTIPLGNVEIWQLTNQSGIAHPFHIHDVQFFVLSRNNATPPATEQGYKDVVLVEPMETVKVITKFEDYTNSTVPYMYHCHMLTHEDSGMMGQFVVVAPTAIGNEGAPATRVEIYPNPTSSAAYVQVPADVKVRGIAVYDMVGQEIQATVMPQGGQKFRISGLPSGRHYQVRILTDRGPVVRALAVH